MGYVDRVLLGEKKLRALFKLQYSLKCQDLNNLNNLLENSVYRNMKCYHPLSLYLSDNPEKYPFVMLCFILVIYWGGFKTSNFFFDLVSEKSRKLLEFKNLRESEGKFEIIFPHILQILRLKNFVTLSVRIFVIRTS